MQTSNVLCHFDPKLPLILATDASQYGVGAVLSHRFPDRSERPIQFASQTLTKTQQKYAQIDKEVTQKSEELFIFDEADVFEIRQIETLPAIVDRLAEETKADQSLKELLHGLVDRLAEETKADQSLKELLHGLKHGIL
ncbi:RNase H-like domain found in reverse transcriptase [Popillia japonica]|uniref:RNase H-like domain found in reverse transcriptase n=1 Tax=Popillia japonica TaxID=7064 RepID=A0AAW1LAM0_POPJA